MTYQIVVTSSLTDGQTLRSNLTVQTATTGEDILAKVRSCRQNLAPSRLVFHSNGEARHDAHRTLMEMGVAPQSEVKVQVVSEVHNGGIIAEEFAEVTREQDMATTRRHHLRQPWPRHGT